MGVSAWEEGVSAEGGVHLRPPVNRMTGVKTLRFPNFVCGR